MITIIEHNGNNVVLARDLYDFLETSTRFNDWITRMLNYGFTEGYDFYSELSASTGGRPAKEYYLTMDCAKEISMIQRTDKGKEARQYFIECEKKLDKAKSLLTSDPIISMRIKQIELEQRVDKIEAQITTRPNYFSIAGYARLKGIKIGLKDAATLGRKAAKACRAQQYPIDETYDPRFGTVNLYPEEVLKEIVT